MKNAGVNDVGGVSPALVSICVCTYRRPHVLARLLDRLTEVEREAEGLAEIAIVIVDDDIARSAESVAAQAAHRFTRGLRYHCSASGNISLARNAALDLGSETSDWLALTDDDCMPDARWLNELITVQRRYGADLVTGSCTDVLAPAAPSWLRHEPFLEPATDAIDGTETEMGYIKNALVAVEVIRRHELRFDPAFGGTGGEDAMFFYTAHERGVHHRHAARALVSEEVPLERCSLRYQLRRRFWYGNTEALTSLTHGRTSRHRMAARGAKLAVRGVLRPIARCARGRTPQLRFSASMVLQGLGRTLGATGITIDHR